MSWPTKPFAHYGEPGHWMRQALEQPDPEYVVLETGPGWAAGTAGPDSDEVAWAFNEAGEMIPIHGWRAIR